MDEIKLQDFIFNQNPSRMDLMNYQSQSEHKVRIAVYRNHSFEMVEHTISAYLDYAGFQAEFVYSDYDDSLSFIDLDSSSDLLILWIDFSRYQNDDIESFIQKRLDYLKTIYSKPILLVPFESDLKISDNQIFTYDLTSIKDQLKNKYIDERLEMFSGTKMSPAASLLCSKDLGLNYLPALLKPALKGIVVDLDNTLYQGVLGEEGVQKVHLSEAHLQLQKKLKDLAEAGFFLCIASKNEEKDVLDLFEKRSDFPLKTTDFTKIYANWEPKSTSITQICQFLNIHEDSLLFIDDNLGELLSVKQAHPQIHLIQAFDDANKTLQALSNYPGLLKLKGQQQEDKFRKKDVQANEERNQLLHTLSKEEYIQDLKMELSFDIDNPQNINRVAELSNKTNQFIFNYKRYSVSEVENLTHDTSSCVVAVSLKDRLSDSGIIGVVVLKKTIEGALLDECFVSCRALGRGIDEDIVLGAISVALTQLQENRLKVQFQVGERNTPAVKFIENHFKEATKDYVPFNYQLEKEYLKTTIKKGK